MCFLGLLERGVNIQVGNYYSDIVNHALFLLPPCNRLIDDLCRYSIAVFLVVELGIHYSLRDFLITHAIKDSVRGHDKTLVHGCEAIENLDLWFSGDAHRACNEVAYRASHGKTGDLFVLEPNSFWTKELRLLKFATLITGNHVRSNS